MSSVIRKYILNNGETKKMINLLKVTHIEQTNNKLLFMTVGHHKDILGNNISTMGIKYSTNSEAEDEFNEIFSLLENYYKK